MDPREQAKTPEAVPFKLIHGRFPQPLPADGVEKVPLDQAARSEPVYRRRYIPVTLVPPIQCASRHPEPYAAIQGWQKLPEPAGMHRRCNGKFGKCLEMNSQRWPVLATFLFDFRNMLSNGKSAEGRLDREYDLPSMRTTFHIRMSLIRPLQREHPVDDGPDLTARQ